MTVIGRVLAPDGQPVPNARVMVHAGLKMPGARDRFDGTLPTPIGRGIGDASGRFRVDADRTTSARHQYVGAVATAPGYGAGWAELDPDADQPSVEIRLRPEQVVEGRLFDVNGRPVAGVRVEVASMLRVVSPTTADGPAFASSHGRERPGWPGSAESDDQGRFTLRGIGRGVRVGLGIDDPRFARLHTTIDTDDAPGPKSATIALEPARLLVGRVTDAETGEPIPHARLLVLAFQDSGRLVTEFEADDQGRFRMNPPAAQRYGVEVTPPIRSPNFGVGKGSFPWPKGAREYPIDLALPRGVMIRGKVIEEGSGRPIAGARISFIGPPANSFRGGQGESEPDGSFAFAVSPGPGRLIVLGPSDDYVHRSTGRRTNLDGEPNGPREYAHAFVTLDPKRDAETPEVVVTLRRGATIRGRLVGPNGLPAASAAMIGRILLPPSPGASWSWRYSDTRRVRDGRFEVHGLDPDAEVPVHFFDPKSRLGATAMLSGRSGDDGPVTIRLEPCVSARARLVAPDGTPAAGFRGGGLLSLVAAPGSYFNGPDDGRVIQADLAASVLIDPARYENLAADADGRIEFPDLIPGATYVLRPGQTAPLRAKEFTAKPGETLDLGTITIQTSPR